jgi:hypothetical protein
MESCAQEAEDEGGYGEKEETANVAAALVLLRLRW